MRTTVVRFIWLIIEWDRPGQNTDIRDPFFRDILTRGGIRIFRVKTKLRHADLVTKNLDGDAFHKHRGYVMSLTSDY